jgi:hypothetical protein
MTGSRSARAHHARRSAAQDRARPTVPAGLDDADAADDLITSGIDSGLAFFVNAGALAAANVIVGVFLFWLLRALVRSTATAARALPHR